MTKKPKTGIYVMLSTGQVAWLPVETNEITKRLVRASLMFIAFLQSEWPKLTHEEATVLATAILDALPELFIGNPDLLQGLSEDVISITSARKIKN